MATATRSSTSRPSVFDARTLHDVIDEIQSVYLRYSIPLIIAYSGGKDSTLALLLWWRAIAALLAEQRTKPIHIVSSNTAWNSLTSLPGLRPRWCGSITPRERKACRSRRSRLDHRSAIRSWCA